MTTTTLTDIGIDENRITHRVSDLTPDDIRGKDTHHGTFGEGTLELHNDRYVLQGASDTGYRIGAVVTTVIFEGTDISPNTDLAPEQLDVTGYDYRLHDGELALRRPPERNR